MARPEAVSFRGKARSLSGLMRGGEQPLTVPVRLRSGEEVFASYRPSAGGLGEVRVALPRKTPAGKHEATLLLPDGEQSVVLEVEPQPLLRFHPPVASVNGGPDQRVTATVTALNEGNGSIEIPKSGGAALYEQNVFECAVGRALREGRKEGEHLLDRIAEAWAEEFGGTLRLSVESGAGTLEPDAVRELTLVMHCPDRLKAGRTYEGRWKFDGGSLSISVRTEGDHE
jgi:hypothetical protein